MTGVDVSAVLDEVRSLVQADGGDLELVDVQEGTLRLRLVLEGAGCAECVMPRPFLEQVAHDIVHRSVPSVTAVRIEDPREAGG